MANSKSSSKNKEIKMNSDIDDINSKIEELAEAISKIADNLSEDAIKDTSKLKNSVREKARSALGQSRDVVEELTHRLESLEGKLANTVKERPAVSLGVAAGVGFLAALLLRK